MTTVASPVSVREQAADIVSARLGALASPKTLVKEIGGAVLADLLIALERRFDIGLEVDEAFDAGTLEKLVDLVELRAVAAEAAAQLGRVYHWDDERLRRGRPYFGGRPRLAVAHAADFSDLAPPAWPHIAETYASPDCAGFTKPARVEIGVPSDEAWATAAALWDRERARRAQLTTIAVVCASAALGLFCAWLALTGFI